MGQLGAQAPRCLTYRRAGLREPAGFAATLAGKKPQVVGGPDIGNRVNLMGGDTVTAFPQRVLLLPSPAAADAVAAGVAASSPPSNQQLDI